MALALYVLCVASFICVFGHRLALQGPHGSLERAVQILIDHRDHIFTAAGLSLVCLVAAAVLMARVKMGLAASLVTIIFIAFGHQVFSRMYLMLDLFAIPDDQLVTGATRVQNPQNAGAVVDLSRLNPASRSAAAATASTSRLPHPADGYARLADEQSLTDTERAAAAGAPDASLGGSSARAPAPPVASLHHEGHLFKRGESGLFGENIRRRYFVLHDHLLFYFKSWEDYGASTTGTRAAINASDPIDMRRYAPRPVLAEGPGATGPVQPNRFDLVPTTDPLARTWMLQGTSAQEAHDWILALEAARRLGETGPQGAQAGQATFLLTPQ